MNCKPPSKSEFDTYHNWLLEEYGYVDDYGIVKSSKHFNMKEMSLFIDNLIMLVLTSDQRGLADHYDPRDIQKLIQDFKNLYAKDLVRKGITWDEYRELVPYCEITFNSSQPLERMHILSGGAFPEFYEESWNWLHAKREVHTEQHKIGWLNFLRKYPHLSAKVSIAHEIANNASHNYW